MNKFTADNLAELAAELKGVKGYQYNQDIFRPWSPNCPVCAAGWAVKTAIIRSQTHCMDAVIEQLGAFTLDEKVYLFGRRRSVAAAAHRLGLPDCNLTAMDAVRRIEALLDKHGWEINYLQEK